jgi:hypothetical protein
MLMIKISWPARRRRSSCRASGGINDGRQDRYRVCGGGAKARGSICCPRDNCQRVRPQDHQEGGGGGSGYEGGEEQVEGEPGGEEEGLRGLQGEPLLGLPLWRGIGSFVAARCDSPKWRARRRRRLAESQRKRIMSAQECKGMRSSPLDQRRERCNCDRAILWHSK